MSKQSNRGSQTNTNSTVAAADTETVVSERPATIDNGEEARGNVNARENQTSTQTEPSDAIVAMGDTVVALETPSFGRGSLAEKRRKLLATAGQTRHQIETVTKQKMAEAADLFRQGGEKRKEGEKILQAQAVDLFVARADGILDAEALNGICRGAFGCKPKSSYTGPKDAPLPEGHPDASATPFGEGEAIRKRVVRAVQAHEYVEGTDASKFFDGLPADKVGDLLKKVRDRKLSLWSAYDYMGKLKQEAGNNSRLSPAFDTKVLGKVIEGLREPNAAERYLASTDLQDIYIALMDLIVATDREATALAAKAKRAA